LVTKNEPKWKGYNTQRDKLPFGYISMTVLSALRRIARGEPSRKAVMSVVKRAKSPAAVKGWSANKLQSEMRAVESAIAKQRLAVKVLQRQTTPPAKYRQYELSGKRLERKVELDAAIPNLRIGAEAAKRSPFDGELSQSGPMDANLFDKKMKLEDARQERQGLLDFEKNVRKKQIVGEARYKTKVKDVLEEYLPKKARDADYPANAALIFERYNLMHLNEYLERLRKEKASR